MKTIVKIVLFLSVTFSYGQKNILENATSTKTYDATADRNTQDLMKKLDDQIRLYKQESQKSRGVNLILKNLSDLKVMSQNYKKAVQYKKDAVQYMNRTNDADGLLLVENIFTNLENSMELVKNAISTNFNMSDKDRMDIIEKEKGKVLIRTFRLEKYARLNKTLNN